MASASGSRTYSHQSTSNSLALIARIMVIVDLSTDESTVLRYSAKLQAHYRCRVFIVAIVDNEMQKKDIRTLDRSINSQLDILSMPYFTSSDPLETAAITVNSGDCNNDATNAICEFVQDNYIDIVLKTNRKLSDRRATHFDRSLIHSLDCNMLFIPEVLGERSTVIIAAIDANIDTKSIKALRNSPSEQVAHWTKTLSENLDCEVITVSVINIDQALHLLDSAGTNGNEPTEKTQLKERVRKLLQENKIEQAKVIISAGDPARKIVNNAHNHNASLVVVGSTDHDINTPSYNGNTAEKILKRIQVPLLIVKNHNQ